MTEADCLERLAHARVATLATVGDDGIPDLVPLVFALDEREILSATDHKQKRSQLLGRHRNIAERPQVAVLAHAYEEDWSGLWWVRAEGSARVVEDGPDLERIVARLTEKYDQYRDHPPGAPGIVIEVARLAGWTA